LRKAGDGERLRPALFFSSRARPVELLAFLWSELSRGAVKRFLVYVLDAFGVSEFEASLHEELPGVDGDLGQMETPRLRNSLRVPKCLLHDFLARLFDFFGFFSRSAAWICA
jgi:hypothetical protein